MTEICINNVNKKEVKYDSVAITMQPLTMYESSINITDINEFHVNSMYK